MKITSTKLPNSRLSYAVELTSEEVNRFFNDATQHLASHVKLPGFRPGKAPKHLAEGQLDPLKVREEAYSQAVGETWRTIVKDLTVAPIEDPAVDLKTFEPDKPAELAVSFDVRPDVKIGSWQAIKIKKPAKSTSAPSQQQIDQVINSVAQSRAKTVAKASAAEMGDEVVVDFTGSINHVTQDKLSAKKFPVRLGDSHTIPGFEDHLVGVKKGEERKFDVTFPKDHFDKELAEKTVEFTVNVEEVFKVILPTLDDEFAKSMGHATFTELTQAVEKDVAAQQAQDLHVQQKADWLQKFEQKITADLPESLIKAEVERLHQEWHDFLHSRGLNAEQWLKQRQTTHEELEKNWRQGAISTIKIGLGLAEVAKELKRELKSNDEFQQLLDELVGKATA